MPVHPQHGGTTQALEPFNVLVNHWSSMPALSHADARALPRDLGDPRPARREAGWREIFEYQCPAPRSGPRHLPDRRAARSARWTNHGARMRAMLIARLTADARRRRAPPAHCITGEEPDMSEGRIRPSSAPAAAPRADRGVRSPPVSQGRPRSCWWVNRSAPWAWANRPFHHPHLPRPARDRQREFMSPVAGISSSISFENWLRPATAISVRSARLAQTRARSSTPLRLTRAAAGQSERAFCRDRRCARTAVLLGKDGSAASGHPLGQRRCARPAAGQLRLPLRRRPSRGATCASALEGLVRSRAGSSRCASTRRPATSRRWCSTMAP